MISIEAIKTCIVGDRVATSDLPEVPQLNEPELEYLKTCGIEGVYDAKDCSGYELAKRAAEELLASEGLDGSDLDFLIYVKSRIPERFIASDATRLQHDLSASRAMAFSISDLGCADSTLALKLARDLLKANRGTRHALICYGHKRYSPRRYRFPVTIQGDGGVAILAGRGERHRIVDLALESNGRYWDLFRMDYLDRTYQDYREECGDERKYGFELAIESKNRFRDINRSLLARHGLEEGGVSHFLLQNISQRAYDYYENAFGIRISPVCKMNLARYGHLGCADILVNYQTGLESGLFAEGDKVLIMNNSPVAAWSSMLVEV